MWIVDGLAPIWCQVICNHHNNLISSWISQPLARGADQWGNDDIVDHALNPSAVMIYFMIFLTPAAPSIFPQFLI